MISHKDVGHGYFVKRDSLGLEYFLSAVLHAAAVLAAGCDLVLHCSGDTAEMEAVAAGAGPITDKGLARLQNGAAMLNTPGDIGGDIDAAAVQARLDEIMNAEGGA